MTPCTQEQAYFCLSLPCLIPEICILELPQFPQKILAGWRGMSQTNIVGECFIRPVFCPIPGLFQDKLAFWKLVSYSPATCFCICLLLAFKLTNPKKCNITRSIRISSKWVCGTLQKIWCQCRPLWSQLELIIYIYTERVILFLRQWSMLLCSLDSDTVL